MAGGTDLRRRWATASCGIPAYDPAEPGLARADDVAVPGARLSRRAGGVRADRRRAGRHDVHADHPAIDDRATVQWRRFRSANGDSVLPAGRRADDIGP